MNQAQITVGVGVGGRTGCAAQHVELVRIFQLPNPRAFGFSHRTGHRWVGRSVIDRAQEPGPG